MSFFIRQDNALTLYTKLEYDMTTWAAEVGGISKSFMAVFGGLAILFSRILFRNLILQSLFMDSKSVFSDVKVPKKFIRPETGNDAFKAQFH